MASEVTELDALIVIGSNQLFLFHNNHSLLSFSIIKPNGTVCFIECDIPDDLTSHPAGTYTGADLPIRSITFQPKAGKACVRVSAIHCFGKLGIRIANTFL